VVVEGMVDVMGGTKITDAVVMVGIEPNCEMTRGKVDVGSMEPDGADVEVGARVGGGHVIYQLTQGVSSGRVGK
ncbi:hypothetical protein KI387_000040, partial [Taxus chinensis]